MSSSFVNSHQHVGLNRVGKYYKTAREKGPYPSPYPLPQGEGEHNGAARRPDEPWRRWTGIVGADEHRLTWKQRKRGIRRLLRQIENRVCHIGSQLGVTGPAVGTSASSGRSRKSSKALDICPGELSHWARTQSAGRTLESICAEFGISPEKLSSLTREYNSMSAQEVLDGYNLRGLRKFLLAQLREAAFHLWGPPGEFAQRRCMVRGSVSRVEEGVPRHEATRSVVPGGPSVLRDTSLRSVARHPTMGYIANTAFGVSAHPAPKRSKYFRTQPWEFFGLLPGDEERLRVSELLGKLDALRDEYDWRVDNLAIQLGFANAAALKRACLNVIGRTLEQIERIMAREIVDYYLAAEDRELRTIAAMDTSRQECLPHHLVYAAREIYCGDAEIVPEEPFLDRWSAAEFAKPEWLAEMRKEFG